jgi:purine nucleoside phosphorylase
VAGLSVITNRGAGLSATPLSHDDVKVVAERVKAPLCDLIARAVPNLA